jgi:phosphatidylglycerophosphate synthase
VQALLVPGAGDPLRHVAGMTLLRRNILTVSHAGASIVVFVTDDPALRQAAAAAHPELRVVPVTEAAAALDPAAPVLLASASRVHDRNLGAALHAATLPPAGALALATPSPAGGPLLLAPGLATADLVTRAATAGLPAARAALAAHLACTSHQTFEREQGDIGDFGVRGPEATEACFEHTGAAPRAPQRWEHASKAPAYPPLAAGGGEKCRLATTPPPDPAFIDLDVTDAATAATATEALWQSCRKPIDGLFSRYFNRYVSLFISRRIVDTPILPNHVSVFCILLGLAAALVTLGGTYGAILLGAILFELNSIIDGVDGELARVRWQFSRTGELLDSAGDNIANFAFYGALTAVMFDRGEATLGWVGVTTLSMWAAHLLYTYARLREIRRGDVMIVRNRVDALSAKSTLTTQLIDVLRYKILRRDGFVSLTLILAALGLHAAILYMVLAGATVLFANVVLHFALGFVGPPAPASASSR